MKTGRLLFIVIAAVLIATSCGGDDDAATTTLPPETTAASTTTSDAGVTTSTVAQTTSTTTAASTTTVTADTTTTTEATTTTTAATTTTAPQILTTIAAGAFDFAAGTSPRFAVTVGISTEGAEGPFVAAGAGPGPTLSDGTEFWVQFTVANTTTSSTITSLTVTIDELGPDNLCPLASGLLPGATLECVAPGLLAEAGTQFIPFVVAASGFRQGESFEDVIRPPLVSPLSHDGVPHSFDFVFELNELDGMRIVGSSNQATVDLALPEIALVGPLSVDCSDTFATGFSDGGGSPQPGEPRVVGYLITVFDGAGTVTAACGFIPTVEVDFLGATDNPDSIFYTGE